MTIGTPFQEELEWFDNSFPTDPTGSKSIVPSLLPCVPKTGQPDFGTLIFDYVPGDRCVELKSLKLYLQKFRNEGIFYENVTNRIANDFVEVIKPRSLKLTSVWGPRGGISSTITVEYQESK